MDRKQMKRFVALQASEGVVSCTTFEVQIREYKSTHGTDMNSTTNKQTVLITTAHNAIVYFIP